MMAGQSVQMLGKRTTVNGLGTRGPEASATPEEGIFRILSLGDSVANGGMQMNDEDTYPMRLQALLAGQGGQRVEVLNAAAGGWALQNEQKWLAEHGTLGARLVLLEVNEKDLDQAFVSSTILDTNPRIPSHPPTFVLANISRRYVMPRLGLSDVADPGSTESGFDAGQVVSARDAVAAIDQQVVQSGGRLAILYWDTLTPRPKAEPARQRLFDWAQQHGVPILRPQLNVGANAKVVYRDSIHPGAKGNEVIAAQLVPFLRPLLR